MLQVYNYHTLLVFRGGGDDTHRTMNSVVLFVVDVDHLSHVYVTNIYPSLRYY